MRQFIRWYVVPLMITTFLFVGFVGINMMAQASKPEVAAPALRELPTAMVRADARLLFADIQEVNQAEEVAKKAQAAAASAREEATAILAEYGIDANDYGRSVAVDFDTGEIQRAPKAVQK